jgi:PAS domain S-box-containing protein
MTEELRLQELQRFMALNLEEDKELKEVVEIASVICQTPFSHITFLDEDKQHLKVRKGSTLSSFPRDTGFCTHTIQQSDILIIPDTQNDDRFADKQLVIEGMPVRFYAGVPLITSNGAALGSLCVIDSKPRDLTAEQQLLLKTLANQVIKSLELIVRLAELEKNEKEVQEQKEFINEATFRLRSFFESSTNFQVLLGKAGEVIDFNKTAFNFIKAVHKTKLKRGDLFVSYIAPSFVTVFIDRYHKALEGERSVEEGSTDYGDRGIIWWDASFEPARDNNDEIVGVSYIIRDVSERKFKEQKIVDQNQSLLKIAHIQAHEFRAPLTTIMGLMTLIKEENDLAPTSYLEFLEQAVANLDEKIKSIVVKIEDGVIK